MAGQDKRAMILAAATGLFSRLGYRRTSIDLLASEAGVAKPTVYAYFDDKEAIFRAVVEHVCDAMMAEADEARRQSGPADERLSAMLSAKFTRYYELVHQSPEASELIDSQGRLGADIIQKADRAFARTLAATIEEALDPSRVGLSPASAAALLIRAASGAAYDATSAASHRRHLREIVSVLVSAMAPLHPAASATASRRP